MKKAIPFVIAILLTIALGICLFILFRYPVAYSELLISAEAEGVTVYTVPHDDLQKIDGTFAYDLYGLYCPGDKVIYIDDDAICPVDVLAHEMGHHYAITYEDDRSESRAEEIAHELIFIGKYKAP